jgi:hypothetical protein
MSIRTQVRAETLEVASSGALNDDMRYMLMLLLVVGCDDAMTGGMGGAGGTGGSGGHHPPTPPPPNDIHFDLSGLNRYVTGNPATYAISGKVTASKGIDHVTVEGMNATLMGDTFSASVPVTLGLNPVAMQGFDMAHPQHSRKGDRALISAAFLPEGQMNTGAASLTLTDQMIQQAAAPLAADIATLDVAGQIMMRTTLTQDSRCTTWPTDARQDPTQFELIRGQDGNLVVHVTVPNLQVAFSGVCQGLIQQINVDGGFATTIEMYSEITPIDPGAGQCLHAFNHAMPDVALNNWQFDVQGEGVIGSIVVGLFGGNQGPTAKAAFQQQFTQQADMMLGMRLANVDLFNKTQMMDFKGVPVTVGMCLMALRNEGGQMRAVIGAHTSGPGASDAPGAPQFDGALPAVAANTLWLDTNLVSQLLFASWKGGGLNNASVMQVDVSLLALLAPGLIGRYPDGTMADVAIHADLPPVIHAATPGMGDMTLELGDLMIDLKVQDELLFRLGANVKVTMELMPSGSQLTPMVTSVDTSCHLLEAPIADIADDVIENVINGKIKDAAPMLVGNAPITLPQIGTITLTPRDVVAEAGGRYLRLPLQ